MSLWGTCLLTGRVDVDTAIEASAPDADHATGARTWLETCSSLGERVVLMALPRPGDYGDAPGGGDLREAALAAGECVFVPGLGGGLVPLVEEYGPPGDRGVSVTWRHHDSDPVAPHVLDAWSSRQAERDLSRAMAEATQALSGLAVPWASRGLADGAAARLGTPTWALPAGLPPPAARLIDLAAGVADLARLATDSPDDGTNAAGIAARQQHLRRLAAAADHALTRGINVAALHLAGLRPGRDD